jgi:hypothetical protein
MFEAANKKAVAAVWIFAAANNRTSDPLLG